MSLALFNARAIEVLLDAAQQPWFKRAHVGKFLGIAHIDTSVEDLDKRESRIREEFESTPVIWESKHHQKTNIFLSVYGVMHVLVNSKNSKGKELRQWILSDIIPRGFNQKIEERDAELALVSDDLAMERDHSRQLEYSDTGLQGEIRAKDQQIAML